MKRHVTLPHMTTIIIQKYLNTFFLTLISFKPYSNLFTFTYQFRAQHFNEEPVFFIHILKLAYGFRALS